MTVNTFKKYILVCISSLLCITLSTNARTWDCGKSDVYYPADAGNAFAIDEVVFNVVFHPRNGAAPFTQTVAPGGKLTPPEDPSAPGFVFGGWYTEEECIHEWDFNAGVVTAHIALYAKWTAMYTVTFDSRGGSDVVTQTVTQGGLLTYPEEPERMGCQFEGWYREAAGINKWDFETGIVIRDFTLFAKWLVLFTVTFDSRGGSDVEMQYAAPGDRISQPADPEYEGCRFEGWYTEEAAIHCWNFGTEVVTANITLYAKWLDFRNVYSVTYNLQDGNPEIRQYVERDSKTIPPADPIRNDFYFGGWYLEESCNNLWNFSMYLITGDITLYARWIPKTTETEEILAPKPVIYPNPFTDEVRITGIAETWHAASLQIINALGITVHARIIHNRPESVLLEHLPDGVYIFRLEKDRQTLSVKVVKRQ